MCLECGSSSSPFALRCAVGCEESQSRPRTATWFSLAATTTNTDRRTRVGGGTASGKTSHALESGEPRDVPLPLFGRAWSAVARPPPRCAGAMRGGFYNTGPCVPVGVWPARATCQGLVFGVWPVPRPGVWGLARARAWGLGFLRIAKPRRRGPPGASRSPALKIRAIWCIARGRTRRPRRCQVIEGQQKMLAYFEVRPIV